MATMVSNHNTHRRRYRQPIACVVILAVVLTTLMLAQSKPAAAQTNSSCAEGTQVGLRCEIEGNPPTTGVGCPTSATVFSADGECFTLIFAANSGGSCDLPYTSVSVFTTTTCSVLNVGADASFVCPAPGAGMDPALTTIPFVDDDNPSLIIRCEQATNASCPIGTAPHDGEPLLCRRPVVLQTTSLCDDGFARLVERCVRYEPAAGIDLSCPEGTLEVTTCKINLGSAFRYEPTCPESGTVIFDGVECFVRVPVPPSGCETGTLPDPADASQCRRPVDLRPSDAFCVQGQIYDQGLCFAYTKAVGAPLLQCTGPAVADPACRATLHYTQPGSEMLANMPTTVAYAGCPNGSGVFRLRAPDSSTFSNNHEVSGALFETHPGVYEASFVAPWPGNFKVNIYLDCGSPVPIVEDFPSFTGAPTCFGVAATLVTTAGQQLVGTAGDDVIVGTAGPDAIDGGGGNDLICGFDGDDVIIAGPGNDTAVGGPGDDLIRGNSGDDFLFGNDGNDRVFGGTGNDMLSGDTGDDRLGGFGGADTIYGGVGADTIFGGFGADQIDGGPGDDVIRGLVGDDTIDGRDGNDQLDGDRGNDVINGGAGDDVINGGNADDQLDGGSGNDEVNGGRGDDELHGGDGTDSCAGNRHLFGDFAFADCEFPFSIP